MAKPELGSKRQCESCSTKFFDLNKDPIVCPRCGEIFQSVHAVARPAVPASADAASEDDDDEEIGADMVPLDEADDTDDGKVISTSEDDVDVDVDVDVESDDDDSGDAFLEDDEDENDDVSGLIDGEIEKDDDS